MDVDGFDQAAKLVRITFEIVLDFQFLGFVMILTILTLGKYFPATVKCLGMNNVIISRICYMCVLHMLHV